MVARGFQGIPPVLVLILKQFHLSHRQGGMLMSMFALPLIARADCAFRQSGPLRARGVHLLFRKRIRMRHG